MKNCLFLLKSLGFNKGNEKEPVNIIYMNRKDIIPMEDCVDEGSGSMDINILIWTVLIKDVIKDKLMLQYTVK